MRLSDGQAPCTICKSKTRECLKKAAGDAVLRREQEHLQVVWKKQRPVLKISEETDSDFVYRSTCLKAYHPVLAVGVACFTLRYSRTLYHCQCDKNIARE